MSSLRERCDFMSNVVRHAIIMGMTQEQFAKLAETAWLVLTAEPAPAQETRCGCTPGDAFECARRPAGCGCCCDCHEKETGESPEAQQQRNSEWDRQREQIAAGLAKNRRANDAK